MQILTSQVQQQQTLVNKNTSQTKGIITQESSAEDGRPNVDDNTARTMMNQYEILRIHVNLNGMRMVMGQTQMPQKAVRESTQVYDWDIRDIKLDEYQNLGNNRATEVFSMTEYPYGAIIKLDKHGYYKLQLIDNSQSGKPIDTRSMPKFTCVFKDLGANTHKKDMVVSLLFPFEVSLEGGKYLQSWSLWHHNQFNRSPYLKSNCMRIKLYVEPPSIGRSFFSNDGILLWRLDNYKERRQMAWEGLVRYQDSPYFYTSPQGYRVLVRLHLIDMNVRGGLVFLTGEFDSSLTRQFPHRLTVTLFNHRNQSKNMVVSGERTEADYTSFYFYTGSGSSLVSGGYINDDSMLIKAEVESL